MIAYNSYNTWFVFCQALPLAYFLWFNLNIGKPVPNKFSSPCRTCGMVNDGHGERVPPKLIVLRVDMIFPVTVLTYVCHCFFVIFPSCPSFPLQMEPYYLDYQPRMCSWQIWAGEKKCSNFPLVHTQKARENNISFLWGNQSTVSMDIFNSYVSLPEGNFEGNYNYIIIVIATINPTLGIT